MLLDGQSQELICNSLGYSISCQSFKHWMELFEQKNYMVQDPETYSTQGPIETLTSKELSILCLWIASLWQEIATRTNNQPPAASIQSISVVSTNTNWHTPSVVGDHPPSLCELQGVARQDP
ncbi:uncharacterized protein VP01_6576g1 [Puccinia sorghi]|uniref:Uncharacterized protein n=1 Tax=Puccinia sorghi TaxID=27349 RepID=A0A0L6UG58_9BASI|nr:uncharacterized protein VP01_6576g1 [Puccinia sorghi]